MQHKETIQQTVEQGAKQKKKQTKKPTSLFQKHDDQKKKIQQEIHQK